MDVDDLIFWGKYEKDIHDMDIKLHESIFDLDQEDDAAVFLGVALEHNKKNCIA